MLITYLALFLTLCNAISNGQMVMKEGCLGQSTPASPLISAPSISSPGCIYPGYGQCFCPAPLDTSKCPQKGKLTINYGRCYRLSDPNGNGLTRGYTDTTYRHYWFGNYHPVRNIVMRICRAGVQSSCTGVDEPVSEDGTWYMLDQTGFLTTTASDFVGALNDGLYLTYPTEAYAQVDFTANMTCLHGKCAPCVRLRSKSGAAIPGHLGLLPQGQATYGDLLYPIANVTNACIPIIFEETHCLF